VACMAIDELVSVGRKEGTSLGEDCEITITWRGGGGGPGGGVVWDLQGFQPRFARR